MVPLSRDSKFVAKYDHLNYWNHTIFYIPLTASWLRRTQSQVRLPCWLRCLQCGTPGFNPWVGKNPWRREWLPTPVFLPEEFHGQRSLVGYSPWGQKESVRHDWMTNTLNFSLLTDKRLEVWKFGVNLASLAHLCNSTPSQSTTITMVMLFLKENKTTRIER